MGWETRAGRRYYYHKQREKGKPVSDYVGSGPLPELIALQRELVRLIAQWKRVGVEILQADFEGGERAYDELSEAVDERVELVLLALGYHRRKGEWRRCRAARPTPHPEGPRGAPEPRVERGSTNEKPEASMNNHKAVVDAAIQSAMQEAQNLKTHLENALADGDHEQYNVYLKGLRKALREHPVAWQHADAHVRETAEALLGAVAKQEQAEWAAALAGMVRLRDELGYRTCPALERLLIDRIALAWLSCRIMDWCHSALAFRGGVEPEHGPYWDRRVAEAERRLARAVEALARTQKLVRATKGIRAEYASLSEATPAAGVLDELITVAANAGAKLPGGTLTTNPPRVERRAPSCRGRADDERSPGSTGAETEDEGEPEDCLFDYLDAWVDAGKDAEVFIRAFHEGEEPWREDFDPSPYEDTGADAGPDEYAP